MHPAFVALHLPSFRVGGSQSSKLQARKHHDPELVFDWDVLASVTIMALLLGHLQQTTHQTPAWNSRRAGAAAFRCTL
jgi:hypothetical protein